ncbi:AmmeMemoRadiSam system radical SAM enzyme [Pseudodesulfovibrio sp. JC047]|uniref:AmmeMemoRadiSam system radical SAM enzyme n=1 Tax=Pseudodesulfovibrio sp. JC047 TaxID=2683199 RepID=UPI0013D3F057|nr:AmmeMemoRadiSam system radical SAM enzyme [Pseudodesulfovibrio sp. JC047]NDV18913.1 AmmeMemoRadiSam system radical SAM enzyme [Pseudodesulfovibrio sp. JC047]
MIEARLWEPVENGAISCRLCNHSCTIEPGQRGQCGVRENRDGTLYSLNYDKVAAHHLDPIEKKPLYHFQPGTQTYSIATMGCNLRCTFCQNWSLSQTPHEKGNIEGQKVTPTQLVDEAIRLGATSISYTYSEPTIFFELIQDTATLAKERGLKNVLVSNGFMSTECLDTLRPLIDAINVDLKCFNEDFYKEISCAHLKPVLANLKKIKHDLKWWLEITTLLIPGRNDSQEDIQKLTEFIARELGTDTPWHISRFHPDYKMVDSGVTPAEALQETYAIGKAQGLKYVYVGNMPDLNRQNTFCPGCGTKLIDRSGFSIKILGIENGHCSECGEAIQGIDMN